MLAVIHAQPRIAWQAEAAGRFMAGLRELGIPASVSDSRHRDGDAFPILLGTTLWRDIERTGPYLLVDRASWGDPDYWQLVRDGHGRRGDHRVPDAVLASRWKRHGIPVAPWRTGRRVVLCGQTETYSPHWVSLDIWYDAVRATTKVTHFRRHPAGTNPTGLPELRTWDDVGLAITLNSSVAVEAVFHGVPTVVMDEAGLAWDVAGHDPREVVTPDRAAWLEWLAWTQWHKDEISEGTSWAHLLW